jgi:hypothetical protein
MGRYCRNRGIQTHLLQNQRGLSKKHEDTTGFTFNFMQTMSLSLSPRTRNISDSCGCSILECTSWWLCILERSIKQVMKYAACLQDTQTLACIILVWISIYFLMDVLAGTRTYLSYSGQFWHHSSWWLKYYKKTSSLMDPFESKVLRHLK